MRQHVPPAYGSPVMPRAGRESLQVPDRQPGVGPMIDRRTCTAYCTTMNAITYSEARANLADTIKRVCRDRNPVIITRKREDTVVMMSLADYESLNETAYLLRTPKNARRLLDAVKQLEAGQGKEHALLT